MVTGGQQKPHKSQIKSWTVNDIYVHAQKYILIYVGAIYTRYSSRFISVRADAIILILQKTYSALPLFLTRNAACTSAIWFSLIKKCLF